MNILLPTKKKPKTKFTRNNQGETVLKGELGHNPEPETVCFHRKLIEITFQAITEVPLGPDLNIIGGSNIGSEPVVAMDGKLREITA